jgi:hypothetical protein
MYVYSQRKLIIHTYVHKPTKMSNAIMYRFLTKNLPNNAALDNSTARFSVKFLCPGKIRTRVFQSWGSCNDHFTTLPDTSLKNWTYIIMNVSFDGTRR